VVQFQVETTTSKEKEKFESAETSARTAVSHQTRYKGKLPTISGETLDTIKFGGRDKPGHNKSLINGLEGQQNLLEKRNRTYRVSTRGRRKITHWKLNVGRLCGAR